MGLGDQDLTGGWDFAGDKDLTGEWDFAGDEEVTGGWNFAGDKDLTLRLGLCCRAGHHWKASLCRTGHWRTSFCWRMGH